jgi:adenine-specific DNA-methyltransferase
MLFDEYKYFIYKFPELQYLGAKFSHLSWINQHIPKNVNAVLDAFAGSQSVSCLFKLSKFETEINPAVHGYVLNSW